MKRVSVSAGVCVSVAMAAGCGWDGSYGVRVYTPPPPTARIQISAGGGYVPPSNGGYQAQVVVPSGVNVMQSTCAPGAQELCNGIDDNCNGVIDEGCGYQTGQIQATASWNGPSDIDLHVFDPAGEEVYYGHRDSASGGHLDHDANAGCSVQPPTVENVYYNTPNPMRGQYRARLVAYNMCNAAQMPVTLSLAVGGRVIGTYQYVMNGQNDTFEIPFVLQ